MNYKSGYTLLVKSISEALDETMTIRVVRPEMSSIENRLRKALEEAEEMYISSDTESD